MGLVYYPQYVEQGSVETGTVVPGGMYSEKYQAYCVQSDGIPAKMLGDKVYFCVYLRQADGTYLYSKVVDYSPADYAYKMLEGASEPKMKALAAAMLNYGAAAQQYFSYRTDALANAQMTDVHKALVDDYRADMVTPVYAADAQKLAGFARTQGFSSRYPTVTFGGAFAINYNFTPSEVVAGDMLLYVWDQSTYENAAVLTKENASAVMTMAAEGGVYEATLTGIAAKDIDRAVYVAGVYTDTSGNTHSTGVLSYSLGSFCAGRVQNGSEGAKVFAAATAVYGYYAREFFYI